MELTDRYILRQILGPFLFFMMVFVGILWLNQALKIVDIVIENGQPGIIFVEFSFYLLPKILESVFPVAAFAAALFLTNRMYSESEYVILQAAGQSPLRFSRPFLYFGFGCFCVVSLLSHIITPISLHAFQKRQYAIQQEYLLQLIKAGEFITPKKNVTFYFGHVREDGVIEDIVIREISEVNKHIIYSAPTGRVLETETETNLVLVDGVLQEFDDSTQLLNVIQFDSFAYDLLQFSKNLNAYQRGVSETTTPHLKWFLNQSDAQSRSAAIESQSRLVKSLFSFLMPLLGAAVLFSGNFSRIGFFYRIGCAIGILFGLNTLRGALENLVAQSSALAITLYTPVLLSAFLIAVLIIITTKGWTTFNWGKILHNIQQKRRQTS